MQKFLTIIGINAVIMLCIVGTMYIFESNRYKGISSMYDTRLAEYEVAKDMAVKFKDLMFVRTQEDYLELYEYFKPKMSSSVAREYFPSTKFVGEGRSLELVDYRVSGDEVEDHSYVFKLEMLTRSGSTDRTLTILLYIEDNIIVKIKSLG